MLNLRVLGFCFAMPDEKNKRTVLQVKYLPFCTAVGLSDQRGLRCGEQSEKRKNNDNEQWNLALANKIQRKDCRKL